MSHEVCWGDFVLRLVSLGSKVLSSISASILLGIIAQKGPFRNDVSLGRGGGVMMLGTKCHDGGS